MWSHKGRDSMSEVSAFIREERDTKMFCLHMYALRKAGLGLSENAPLQARKRPLTRTATMLSPWPRTFSLWHCGKQRCYFSHPSDSLGRLKQFFPQGSCSESTVSTCESLQQCICQEVVPSLDRQFNMATNSWKGPQSHQLLATGNANLAVQAPKGEEHPSSYFLPWRGQSLWVFAPQSVLPGLLCQGLGCTWLLNISKN